MPRSRKAHPQFAGARLRALREAVGLNQTELAARVGVSHTAIQAYESGTIAPSTMVLGKLAHALSVSVAELFDNDPSIPYVRVVAQMMRPLTDAQIAQAVLLLRADRGA